MQQTQEKSMGKYAEASTNHAQPASPWNNKPSNTRSKCTRPHSKTTVFGASLKTRMHCNHLVPKCRCSSISHRKRTHKSKHVVQGHGLQQRVISSSCTLPKDEMNGRKIYQSTNESHSLCDASWRAKLNHLEDRSKTNNGNHHHKSNDGDARILKKKLRFEDEVTDVKGRYNPGHVRHSVKNMKNDRSPWQDSSHTQNRTNSDKDQEWKAKQSSKEYCRLCEAPDKRDFGGAKRIKKKYQVHNKKHAICKSDLKHYDSISHHEICFLCQRYGNYKCIHNDNYCTICNTHIYCSQEDITKSEPSLCHQGSTPASVGGGEDKYSPLNKIPYEPRTKFVKNLKEKLETNYMKDKSDQRTSVETGAALREEEGYEDSPRHQANQRHHKHHGKKCLHRYQQNERLFLEPTIVNRKGQSLCAECSAPQPRNPHREPYLYHITLGGLKTNGDKRLGTASINGFSNWGKENNRVSNMKSKKVSADKSRFVYAKLNDRIDNVLGGKNLHSEHSAQLSSPISSYTKRPPSRSMALMDHII
ncbi:uncharacterized protein LOC123516896 isoform X1 [Portunus trituberculatus]|uniref:uncharacterized protein LOC123516896 isoform X1 n=1 Tax=Portunus trituberculatus TaxID=210409 RepID=UPI001E1D07CA|nr:uncharacterized protein LOC123516896 isoform X1 [Portunus trituberculatus]XP_045132575.1 uncharacterized protein LOC123516896 isoform X1 [Portunus trituberculatus]XP_045132576.1 uncharacterized protein LOC123516896 isoform X1 [Portunus trituberculatus]XP_045132577.1 uncharacterized protein LOC123516896 isoform X1 [Portunus trituberculatus]XP_045132578.1 uncharacterized protein LOC123516896 isoform X1 [Portunus trituberculatus]XP_045132579.1 uncharacterized protein LOC123516896 isoform X1 [P